MRIENGYHVWTRGPASQLKLGAHFRAAEFECFCSSTKCVEQKIAVALIDKLELVRAEYGGPIVITDGFRCPAAQQELRDKGFPTTKGISMHELGNAVDFKARQMTKLVPIVKKHFRAVGLAKRWLHADLRADKERLWYYT